MEGPLREELLFQVNPSRGQVNQAFEGKLHAQWAFLRE